ncbi:DNA-directed DNA polymerase [Tanacetum coccineum]
MEEMLNKFIDEGKQEHEEMRAFIYDFQTNNELLFKERNNSIIELRFGVQELLNVINNVPMIDCDIKGVTTRDGRTTTQDVHNNETNVLPKEPVVVEPEKPAGSDEVLTNDQPQITSKPVVQPSNEVQPPPVPFPKRLRKEKDEAQQKKFLENLKQLHINLPFIEALAQMPKCSAVLLNKLPSKEKDPVNFTIPCDIGQLHIDNALADLGASISLMPYMMYKKLGLGEPKATRMSLELADRSIQYPRGIIENVLIIVDKFVLPIDFVILDITEDSSVPIILRRPFLATARAMIDVDQSIKRPTTEDDECYEIDDLDDAINEKAQELLANEEPDSSDSENSIRRINSINTPYPATQETTNGSNVKSEHLYSASANEIDEKKPELKNLPKHLEYAYLYGDESFPIIISSKLSKKEKNSLLQVLERRKGAIASKMSDIKGIRFFQIPIALEDQEKTTFTCPYRTFAYRRMPFGLCNAPATFQRCMMAIFHDMVEDFMEVFMDDLLGELGHCHSGPTGGHHSASITGRKVYESGFDWPSIFKDAKDYVMRCDACQRSGNISSRSEMPQNNIQNCLQDTTRCTPFRLVYGKASHLPMEIEHKAYWVLKQCNMDLTAAEKNRFMKLNELIELRDEA